ncbi:MAG: CPBP family glutamic-type intramembrane protease [Opitutales bacterium]
MNTLVTYLEDNLWAGAKTSPLCRWRLSLLLALAYALPALGVGLFSGLLEPRLAELRWFFILPFTLLIFPSLLEEAFFRGLLIPRNAREKGPWKVLFYTLLSTVLFVLWHPLNALTINPEAQDFFLDPAFLIIVFLLGISCSLSYIYSRSLWTPTIIHWLTVLIWVLFLGGRNLVLE